MTESDLATKKPKRKKPVSATKMSLDLLRGRGCAVGIVEKWNPHVGIRQDLFGFVDLVAVLPTGEPFFVQTTTGVGVADHIAKILRIVAEPGKEPLAALVRSGRVVVHGWRKTNDRERGARKTWDCREVVVTIEQPRTM